MSHRESFKTTFKEKDFSKYDWDSLKNNSPKGKLRDLCDKLLKYIENYTDSHTFLSHSNLYELLNNLFNAYLSWSECKIPLYQLLKYVNTKYKQNNTDNDDNDDYDIDHKDNNNNNNNKSLLPTPCQLLILDILSLHWNKIKSFKYNKNKTDPKSKQNKSKPPQILKYEQLVSELSELIDSTLLKTKLNAECCYSLKIFTATKFPKTKDIDPISTLDRRRKTKMYYVQNKFNLLIEETEGYSKLITELAEHLQSNQYKQSLYSYQNHNYTKDFDDVDIINGYGMGMDMEMDPKIDEDDDIKMVMNGNGNGGNITTNNAHNNNNSEDDSDDVDMAQMDDGNDGNNNGKNKDKSQYSQLENKVYELIGQFKLDPNRYAIYTKHHYQTMAILPNLPLLTFTADITTTSSLSVACSHILHLLVT